MAGRKQKPCEWCEQDQIFQTSIDARNSSGQVEIYPDNAFISIWFWGKSDDGEQTSEENMGIPMNYCPNCGRKLGW